MLPEKQVKNSLLVAAATLGEREVPIPLYKANDGQRYKRTYNHRDHVASFPFSAGGASGVASFPFSAGGAFEVASSVVRVDRLSDSEFASSLSDGAAVEAPSSEPMSEVASEAMLDGSDASDISGCGCLSRLQYMMLAVRVRIIFWFTCSINMNKRRI